MWNQRVLSHSFLSHSTAVDFTPRATLSNDGLDLMEGETLLDVFGGNIQLQNMLL